MKSRLVRLLRCPACRGTLRLDAREMERGGGAEPHVMTGRLHCDGCHAAYAVSDGIPRLLGPTAAALEEERGWTASRFGYLWSRSVAAPSEDARPYHFEKIQAAVDL